MRAGIDHLVYGTPDLEWGRDEIERALGVRPALGGRHPAWGTRNALVSLGPATYLEVLAPDPDAPAPARGILFGVDRLAEPRIVTWAARVGPIEAARTRASKAGLGPIEAGSRRRDDGSLLSWKLTDPYAVPLDGAVPFLIDWEGSEHPAASAPDAGELTSLRLGHPRPERLLAILRDLGVAPDVYRAERVELTVHVRTADGPRELR